MRTATPERMRMITTRLLMDIEKTYADPQKATPLILTVTSISERVFKAESESRSFVREFVSALCSFTSIYQKELPACWPTFCLGDYQF